MDERRRRKNERNLAVRKNFQVVEDGIGTMCWDELVAYHHRLSLSELVEWAESVMQDGDFEDVDYGTLREIVGRASPT